MREKNPRRLREYLELITRQEGGFEALHEKITPAGSGLEAAAGPASSARSGLERLERGQEVSENEFNGLEAIINADLRPAVDVIDGRFRVDHPYWIDTFRDAALVARLESVIPSIGRVELPGNDDYPYGGTAFVVGDRLLMTNRHVAEIFTKGLGDRRLTYVPGSAGINFLRERNREGRTSIVGRVLMIHPFWDMAILELEERSGLPSPMQLSTVDARDLVGRNVAVVGYPAFDPRNPASEQNKLFGGDYGIKRLQPGKLQGGWRTSSFGKVVPAATHDCSTLGGNSGSAVIDLDTGHVLALHFGGAYHQRNYAVPSCELSRDQRVVDAKVSFAQVPSGGPNDWAGWWTRADQTESAPQEDRAVMQKPTLRATGNGSSASIDIPLRITISIGDSVQVAAAAEAVDGLEKLAEPFRDRKYSGRKGYDPDFLSDGTSVVVPMPEAADPGVLAPLADGGGKELKYANFSILMHAARRLALIAASNVTKETALRRPDPDGDYTRKGLSGLGKNDMEKWFLDPRLEEKYQLPDVFFTKDRQAFDKGHIVRRDDVAWGKTYAALRRANGDTYHVTNCSPQVADFNRSAGGEDNWGDLENHVLKQAGSERLCVFAGPVLTPDDEMFVGVGDGGVKLRTKIPSRYWKVIVARNDDGIASYGFVLEQDLTAVEFEFVVPDNFAPAMYPLSDIAEMAGVEFDQSILDADQYETTEGVETAFFSHTPRRRMKTRAN